MQASLRQDTFSSLKESEREVHEEEAGVEGEGGGESSETGVGRRENMRYKSVGLKYRRGLAWSSKQSAP